MWAVPDLQRQAGQFAAGWRLSGCADDTLSGLRKSMDGQDRVLLTYAEPWMPCTLMTRASQAAGEKKTPATGSKYDR